MFGVRYGVPPPAKSVLHNLHMQVPIPLSCVHAVHAHCRGAVCRALRTVLQVHPGAVPCVLFPVPPPPPHLLALPALRGGGGGGAE